MWSWHPDAGVKFAGSSFRRRWWLKSPVHQGDHGVTVTPLRRECRFDSGEPVVTTLACFTYIRTRGCGCHRASGIPCALFSFEGARNSWQNLGAWRGEIAESCRIVIAGESGRPSIPGTVAMEAIGRGVLDTPHARGMTTFWVATPCSLRLKMPYSRHRSQNSPRYGRTMPCS